MEVSTNRHVKADNSAPNVNVELSDPLISDTALFIFQYACYCSLNQFIALFGVASNIANMICFIKQGFKDSVNVSLFGLAVSDLGCLVTVIWLNISLKPSFLQEKLSFQQLDLQYLTASWPHVVFSRISSFFTVFITLERCMCIALPLKVKLLFTPTRVSAIFVTGFVFFIVSVAPVYCVNIVTSVFLPERNNTLMAIIRTVGHARVEQAVLTLNVVSELLMYISVAVCTAVLITKLQNKTKWRQTAVAANSDSVLSRDKSVAKIIAIISTIFIISYTPICAIMVARALEPELAINGLYKNTMLVIFGIGAIMETINASVNIFIYYKMSSKHRATFLHIFGLTKTQTSEQNLVKRH